MNYPKNQRDEPKHTRFPSFVALSILLIAVVGLLLFFKTVGTKRHSTGHTATNQFARQDASSAAITTNTILDLAAFYNAGLKTNWLGGGKVIGRDLSLLPTGTTSFGGVPFSVQGVIQLRGDGRRSSASIYPEVIKGIPVHMMCSRLHFLHATAWSAVPGTKIAAYNIHFADGSQLAIPLFYGSDVRDWSFDANDPYQTENTAWSSKKGEFFHRLYKSAWENPKPQVAIQEIDFVSLGTRCYPFLLAITVE